MKNICDIKGYVNLGDTSPNKMEEKDVVSGFWMSLVRQDLRA